MRVWAVDIGIQRNNRCKGSTFLRMMRLVKNKIQQLTSSLSQLADRNFPSAPNEICRTAGSVDRERLQCAVKSIHAKPIRYPTYLLFVFTQTRHIFSYQIGETVQTDFCRLFVLVISSFFTSIFFFLSRITDGSFLSCCWECRQEEWARVSVSKDFVPQ